MGEIQEVKKHKMNLEETIKTLRQGLVIESIASDGDRSHVSKAASFAKTLAEKEKTIKDLTVIQGKLENECKVL